jgi:hypothetical protein
MSDDQEEMADKRALKITALVGMIEQLGQDNGSGDQYIAALTVAAGRYIRRMPDASLKAITLHQFLQSVRQFAGEKQ